ncbi:hypothetical protein [Urbifossiella limnaea]|uniref:Uncharacterized protein n=1 Tax=Urbifossiella limnaea TaxID=2528023 RepID=A0A517Y0U2_9BACT|nr:hypothetical protein [Urbifossiella limnaea]QDU23379.1 hypothetical protein ETAA1_53780 [Urbifossiella limnaea]
MSSERPPTPPTPDQLPPAATFLPAGVRNWLTARYLADPNPARWQLAPAADPEPVVFVRFPEFAAFLLAAGVDLLPSLDAWKAAGWIADVRAELRPSDDPAARPPDFRLSLPAGDHRLVAIRRAALDAPTEPPATGHPTRRPAPTHLQRIDAQAAAIDTRPPHGLDPELAEAFVATAVAFRECTRLIDSAPALWEDAAAYRRLAAGVHAAADALRPALDAVDTRLRRAGGPHVMREALNDVLTLQAHAPLDPAGRRGGLNAVVTGLFRHGDTLFGRVDGRGLLDRLRDQLARFPPVPGGAPVAAGRSGDALPAFATAELESPHGPAVGLAVTAGRRVTGRVPPRASPGPPTPGTPPMSDHRPRWEPGRDPVHRLIQCLDVVAIALHRFHQQSFRLPRQQRGRPCDPEGSAGWFNGRDRLRADFEAVRDAVCTLEQSDAVGGFGQLLYDEAAGEFTRLGAWDEATRTTVAEAATWVNHAVRAPVAGIGPTPRPWHCDISQPVPSGQPQHGVQFEQEQHAVVDAARIRTALISALVQAGGHVPSDVRARRQLYSHSWQQADPITPDELLALARLTNVPPPAAAGDAKQPTAVPRPAGKSALGVDGTVKRVGRPILAETTSPVGRARHQLYLQIRAAIRKDPALRTVGQLVAHFQGPEHKDFLNTLRHDVRVTNKTKFFRAALKWVKDNPDAAA